MAETSDSKTKTAIINYATNSPKYQNLFRKDRAIRIHEVYPEIPKEDINAFDLVGFNSDGEFVSIEAKGMTKLSNKGDGRSYFGAIKFNQLLVGDKYPNSRIWICVSPEVTGKEWKFFEYTPREFIKKFKMKTSGTSSLYNFDVFFDDEWNPIEVNPQKSPTMDSIKEFYDGLQEYWDKHKHLVKV